jgi:hypothetical protein
MKITFVNGENAGRVYEFVLPQITVGREDANDLRLPSGGVSRYHAKFKQELLRGGWTVSDQGSTNGVKVNGERISGEWFLSENDRVEIGEQVLMVSDLSSDPPKIVFNPINSETPGLSAGPAPGAAVGGGFAEKDEPPKKESSEGGGLLASLGSTPLFSGAEPAKEAAGGKGAAEKETASSGKRAMSPVVFYSLVAVLAAVAIVSCLRMFSARPAAGSARTEPVGLTDAPLTLYFEKVDIQRDNVFRFSLLLEKNSAVFHVDDIRSRRHPEALTVEDPSGLQTLRSRIERSGIWNVKNSDVGRDGSGIRRRIGIIFGPKVVDLVIDGRRTGAEVEEVENAIYEFAEGCGMQTVSMSGEEIMRLAEDNFNKAEDLYANREADGANLRDAISRYRVVVNYLGQFAPPPPMWKRAKACLAEAEKLREKKLEELEYERVRLQNVRDFASLRRVFLQIMELTESGSKPYDTAQRRLYILDSRLKKGRGSR